MSYFTAERDGRLPARNVDAEVKDTTPTEEEVRAEQARRLERYEFKIKELGYLIEIDRLELRRKPDEPPNETRNRINRYMNEIDDIVLECRTVAESAVRQRACNAEIDTMPIPDNDKKHLKDLASKLFERFRLQNGGIDIPIEKDHRADGL